jgi:anaerobic ribonucleoside-triphosphate reductase
MKSKKKKMKKEEEQDEVAGAEDEERARPANKNENDRFARIIEEEKRINKVDYALMRALSDDVLRKVIEHQNHRVKM